MEAALLEIHSHLLTGGQPTVEQLHAIARTGYQSVINLALHDAVYSLPDERALVESLGMRYHHLPVIWEAPSLSDYRRFAELMRSEQGWRLFVHCAANKRVSIFLALYHICERGWNQGDAWANVLKVWEPDARWRDFFVEVLQAACECSTAPEFI
jgi:protein tyrosine phosphatase (PTP) superfamily phosphohydrolase (DUF442 family)